MARLWINRRFLLALTALIAGLCALMAAGQLGDLLALAGAERVERIVGNEETIALLLVGLGALLEGREVMAQWVGVGDDPRLNEACEYYGFMILTVGLLIEIVDQVIGIAAGFPRAVLGLHFGVNVPLNAYAFVLLAATARRLWTARDA